MNHFWETDVVGRASSQSFDRTALNYGQVSESFPPFTPQMASPMRPYLYTLPVRTGIVHTDIMAGDMFIETVSEFCQESTLDNRP